MHPVLLGVVQNGDIFLLDIKSGRIRQITNTVGKESDPNFTHDEKKITFMRDDNLYLWRIDNGETIQLTDFREGKKKPEEEEPKTDQEKWVKEEELRLIRILKERKDKKELAKEIREAERQAPHVRPDPLSLHPRHGVALRRLLPPDHMDEKHGCRGRHVRKQGFLLRPGQHP